MTKADLLTSYISKGWVVDPITSWTKVSDVNGVVKYDVNVVSPNNQFGVAQVVVTNDGTATEAAVPTGVWETQAPSFSQQLRTYLDGLETSITGLFAVAVLQVSESDQVAVVDAYMTDHTVQKFVVKYRNGSFTYQATA